MAEKFPALENEDETPDQITSPVEDHDETDFLKREAEILGDEFKTENDVDLLEGGDNGEDDEFDEFTTNNDNNNNTTTTSNEDTTINEANAVQKNKVPIEINDDAERVISEWRETHQKEIASRDEKEDKEKNELQNEAITYIDEFYETYNKKKEEGISTTQAAAQGFIEKRDIFFQQEDTTTWDRAFQLINEDDAAVVNGRDRTKFKEILQRLQGKVDAPGA